MIRPFGESALLVEVASPDVAQRLAASLDVTRVPGVTEVVPGIASVLVEIDPLHADAAAVGTALSERLGGLPERPLQGRPRTIPVVYGGRDGPDLADVAGLSGLTEAEVVELHASTELRVLLLGFAPGFAYLGELPERLRAPRLATPRTTTPPGSVGIAGSMSGIYPAALPGGWRVIGRTPARLFDPHRHPPAYLAPGDRVRFEPISVSDWEARSGPPSDWA